MMEREILLEMRENNRLMRQFMGVDNNRFNFVSNSGRITSDSDVEMSRKDVKTFGDVVKQNAKVVKKQTESMSKLLSNLGRAYPRLDKFYKNSIELELSTKKQSETVKKSAKAMDAFTRSTSQNSKEMQSVSKSLAAIERASKKVQESVQKRQQIEVKLSEISRKHLNSEIKIKNDLSNLDDAISKISKKISQQEKELQKASRKRNAQGRVEKLEGELAELNDTLSDLKSLSNMPKATQELKQSLRALELKDVTDPQLRAVLQDLKEQASDDAEKMIDNLGGVQERIRGLQLGLTTALKSRDRIIAASNERLSYSIQRLVSNIGVYLQVAGIEEARRTMLRRQLTARGASGSARMTAFDMGMSEPELLEAFDRNRFLLRRTAVAAGSEEGALGFVRSGQFGDQFTSQMKSIFGLIGVEAMGASLDILETLRRTGAMPDPEAFEQVSRFLRDARVDAGMTREEMLSTFRTMADDGLFGVDRLLGATQEESLERMQQEIETRIALRNELNQDVETMQRLNRERASFFTSDVTSQIRQLVGIELLASELGFSAQDMELLTRYFRQDQTLTEEERRSASFIQADLSIQAGTTRAEAVSSANFGQQAFIERLGDMAGISMANATQDAIRDAAGPIPELHRSVNGAQEELGRFEKIVYDVTERIRGFLGTSGGQTAATVLGGALKMAVDYAMIRAAVRGGPAIFTKSGRAALMSQARGATAGASMRFQSARAGLQGGSAASFGKSLLGRAAVPVSAGFLLHDLYQIGDHTNQLGGTVFEGYNTMRETLDSQIGMLDTVRNDPQAAARLAEIYGASSPEHAISMLEERISASMASLESGAGTFSGLRGSTLTSPFGAFVNRRENRGALSRASEALSSSTTRRGVTTLQSNLDLGRLENIDPDLHRRFTNHSMQLADQYRRSGMNVVSARSRAHSDTIRHFSAELNDVMGDGTVTTSSIVDPNSTSSVINPSSDRVTSSVINELDSDSDEDRTFIQNALNRLTMLASNIVKNTEETADNTERELSLVEQQLMLANQSYWEGHLTSIEAQVNRLSEMS